MKPPTNPSVCCRRSERGGALLYALVISFFGVVLVTSLGTYFSSLTKSVLKNNDIGAMRAALHSSMDYTLNGIRNRWCFAENWTPAAECKITDPNNVERLLISDEALRAIEAAVPDKTKYGGDISKIRTKSFTGKVKWADINPSHPLYYVVQGLEDLGEDFTFNFKVVRVDNGVQKGREALLQVTVEIDLGLANPFKLADPKISTVSSILVFPREINTNALMIANNLFLDRPDPGVEKAANGNVYFSPVSNVNTPGLQFDSPVFVNNNIYIPGPDVPGYTPVTFADKVIIGGGMVLSGEGNAALFSKPRTAGGSDDRFYSQAKNFGGFLKGILLDPGPDEGLTVLAQVKGNETPTPSETSLCIKRSSAKTDFALTKDSQLFLKVTEETNASVATAAYGFTAHLGELDNFYKQGKGGSVQFKSASPASIDPTVQLNGNSDAQRPIMRLNIALNGFYQNPNAYVAADLSANAVMTIRMNPNDPSAILRITTSPYIVGANAQNNAVNIRVEMTNQDKFALYPYPVKTAFSNLTTTAEPSIEFNIEAFDVAYSTNSASGVIESQRKKGGPEMPLGSDCKASDADYNMTDPSGAHHCYPRYAWHASMGKFKSNGFKLKREHGSTDMRFILKHTAGATSPSPGYLGCSALDSSCPYYASGNPPTTPERDWVEFDKNCYKPPKGTDMFPSFAAADWDTTSFTDDARRSWGFTEPGTELIPGYNPGTLVLDAKSSSYDGVIKPVFMVAAIYKNCEIQASANFVAGFFVCDNLTIAKRTTPLRIIGSFIVSRMSIDPSAMEYGIRWSNIYHANAVYELRRVGILNTSSVDDNCDIPTEPLWHPYPSVKRTQFLFKCNPISLRSKADPFKWTMVDPDCGLVGMSVQCKYRVMRFELVELKRQEFL